MFLHSPGNAGKEKKRVNFLSELLISPRRTSSEKIIRTLSAVRNSREKADVLMWLLSAYQVVLDIEPFHAKPDKNVTFLHWPRPFVKVCEQAPFSIPNLVKNRACWTKFCSMYNIISQIYPKMSACALSATAWNLWYKNGIYKKFCRRHTRSFNFCVEFIHKPSRISFDINKYVNTCDFFPKVAFGKNLAGKKLLVSC